MYKIILLGLVSLMFTGCFTNKIYNSGKKIYVEGREIVIDNYDELPPSIQDKLKTIDNAAIKYDEVRSKIKKEADVDSSQKEQVSTSNVSGK